MQTSVPEVMDITKEPKHILETYGAKPGGANLANNCLLARRLSRKRESSYTYLTEDCLDGRCCQATRLPKKSQLWTNLSPCPRLKTARLQKILSMMEMGVSGLRFINYFAGKNLNDLLLLMYSP